ncbi:hypothetical protein [Mycetocola spongiae]|uniref:hypothetical protein n=1 Tax=Mycetocola spongiae TaxID=2859226 RepID=UPI001CF18368|nr:hypothetical protein [Mycetocola spongiae]UCR87912.1 hypothetical protein KXZ72_07730 [Mycetocola spongiae]
MNRCCGAREDLDAESAAADGESALIALLSSPLPRERSAAARALGRVSGPQSGAVTHALVQALRAEKRSLPRLRMGQALEAAGVPASIALLGDLG